MIIVSAARSEPVPDHNRAGLFVGVGRYDGSLFASGLRYQYFLTPADHSLGLGAETNLLVGERVSWQVFAQAIVRFRSGIKLWLAPGYIGDKYSSSFHRTRSSKRDRPMAIEPPDSPIHNYALEIGASAEIEYREVSLEPTARVSFYGAAYIIFGMTFNYTF